MAPWLMALAFVSNAALATQSLPLAWLFVSQIAFYGTAVAGWVVSPLRQFRIVRLVMAFLLMNWFAVLGFLEFLRNRNAHMWRDSTLDPGRTG
jgi:hypothetical protein